MTPHSLEEQAWAQPHIDVETRHLVFPGEDYYAIHGRPSSVGWPETTTANGESAAGLVRMHPFAETARMAAVKEPAGPERLDRHEM